MAAIIPRPRSLVTHQGRFLLDERVRISAVQALDGVADLLQERLRRSTGLPFHRIDEGGSIRLGLDADLGAEAYRIVVDTETITITGGTAHGVFDGTQVLMQLLPARVFRSAPLAPGDPIDVPSVVIEDEPRFAWRGVMLDVARHFMPKRDVMRFIDLMAVHRLNTLHWHLSDDQGWRVEVSAYPLLTRIGGWRHETQIGPPPASPRNGRPHGGFYTQDDIREIVAYAEARHIEIVPEIDVPGHSQAAIAAYPELGVGGEEGGAGAPRLEVATDWGVISHVLNTEDSTVRFYIEVFDELMQLFPGRYIGVGGDECPTDAWQQDRRTQELMRQRGLSDEHQLQAWFIAQLEAHVVARGRRPYGWDELLESDPDPQTVIASWRGMAGARAAVRRGYAVVACPDDKVYLDYRQSEMPDEPIPFSIPLSVRDAYSFRPVPEDATADEAALILGGQANVWTEHMDSSRVVDYYVFPRLCAIAEVLWGTQNEEVEEFEDRLRVHLTRLDALGVEYRHDSGPMPWQRRPEVTGRPSNRSEHEALISALVANIVP